MPKGSVKRGVARPPAGDGGRIERARGVLEAERGTGEGGVERGEVAHVAEIGVRVVDVEVGRVDLVEAEGGVHVGQRGDAGADPGGCEGGGGVDGGCVVCVEEGEVVFVGVAEEDAGDDVRRVAVDDLVEEVAWVGEGVGAVPAAGDVADDPDAFARVFGFLEFADHPREGARGVRIGRVDEVEVVRFVPEVRVEGDDAEAVLRLHRISAVVRATVLRCSRADPPFVQP